MAIPLHPTPVLSPGKSHGWRSLVGCSPWGHEESDMTERLDFHFSLSRIGEGNGSPLQCSCLENPRDGAAWWAAIYGVAESRTRLKWLSNVGKSHGRRPLVGFSPRGCYESGMTEQLHFWLSCIGEGNGNPLQCSCLENPRDRGAWWAAVYWVTQSWTWLKRLSSSSVGNGRLFKLLYFGYWNGMNPRFILSWVGSLLYKSYLNHCPDS